MIAGVCNGMAAYVNVDPTLVRLAFVLLTMLWGTGVLAYLVMAIVVPEARSPEEKAAASGNAGGAESARQRFMDDIWSLAAPAEERVVIESPGQVGKTAVHHEE